MMSFGGEESHQEDNIITKGDSKHHGFAFSEDEKLYPSLTMKLS